MKTDQYLKEKLFKDANTIVGQKRNEFVNTLKQMNQDLPDPKFLRRILDMSDEGSLVIPIYTGKRTQLWG